MTEPVTIIGIDTVVSGNLEGDEDLTVEGRVEGSIALSKTLSIEVGGVVRADVNVRNAVISGVLVGNIEAQESVHITEQGRVVGDIAAPRVILVDGASFKGNVDMGDFDVEQDASAYEAPRSAPAPTRHYEEPEAVVEEAAPAAPVRRAVPVKKAVAKAAKPARRAVPVKTKATKKAAPAPKVRSVGKKKAGKKK